MSRNVKYYLAQIGTTTIPTEVFHRNEHGFLRFTEKEYCQLVKREVIHG